MARSGWSGDLEGGADAQEVLPAEALDFVRTVFTTLVAHALFVGEVVGVNAGDVANGKKWRSGLGLFIGI